MLQSFPVFIIEDIQRINKLWLYFGIVAFLIFAAVFFSVIFFAKKYKAKSQDETPQQSHGNRKFEVGMTLLSTTIIVVFFFLTINTMNNPKYSRSSHTRFSNYRSSMVVGSKI